MGRWLEWSQSKKTRTGKACSLHILQKSQSQWVQNVDREGPSELSGEAGGTKKARCQAGKVGASNTASQGTAPEERAAMGLLLSRIATSREPQQGHMAQGGHRQRNSIPPYTHTSVGWVPLGVRYPGDGESEWARTAEAWGEGTGSSNGF